MNKHILMLLVCGLVMSGHSLTANAAELAIAPPPIATPSYEDEATRIDFTYIGFDELDGDGFGVSFNHKNPMSDVSGFNIVGSTFGLSFDDGDSTGVILNLGANYERQLIGTDSQTLIGFIGPLFSYLYFETCTLTCTEFDTNMYGGQAGLQWHLGSPSGMQVAPFVITQSLSGSDVDTITTTILGIDLLFGDWSLSGALNQTEDDDITIVSVGYRF